MKPAHVFSLAALLMVVWVCPTRAPAAGQVERRSVIVNGRSYPVVPDDVLRRLGLEVPEVPREQNAAYDYLAALEAHVRVDDYRRFRQLCDKTLTDGWPEAEDAKLLVQYLEDNRDALALLERAAAKPGCHFPFLLFEDTAPDDVRVSEIALPHL